MLVLLIPFPFTMTTHLDYLSFLQWIDLVTPDLLEVILSPLRTSIQPRGIRAIHNFTIPTQHHSAQPRRHNIAIMYQCRVSTIPSPIVCLSTVSLLINHLIHTKSPNANQIHIEIAARTLGWCLQLKITDSPTIRDTKKPV